VNGGGSGGAKMASVAADVVEYCFDDARECLYQHRRCERCLHHQEVCRDGTLRISCNVCDDEAVLWKILKIVYFRGRPQGALRAVALIQASRVSSKVFDFSGSRTFSATTG